MISLFPSKGIRINSYMAILVEQLH